MSAFIICFEGLDCSFKETNSKALHNYFVTNGFRSKLISFPNYSSDSSYFVREYLSGKYGKEVDPFTASLFYATDRYDTYMKDKEKGIYEDNDIIIFDRYVSSNMIYQGAKLDNIKDRSTLVQYIYGLEYGTLKLPKPNLQLFLDVPYEISQELMKEKDNADIHEQDEEYEKSVYKNAQFVINRLNNFKRIDCTQDGKLLTPELLFNRVLDTVLNSKEFIEGVLSE